MRIKVQYGDEELAFSPDEFHAKLQDARQNAALQFVQWLAHYQMTGEKFLLREDAATPATGTEGTEDEHDSDTELSAAQEELAAPVFAYWDFVRAMALQYQLEHDAAVWSQPSPVTSADKLSLEGYVLQDMLGDLTLMKLVLVPGQQLVEDDVKAYRGTSSVHGDQ